MPSLYASTIKVFIRDLTTLSKLLTKAAAHSPTAEAQSTLLALRLHPTMEGLAYQIQRVSDTAKGVAVRLGEVENVSMADDEKSLDDLQDRIKRTIKVLEEVKADKVDAKEETEIVVKPNPKATAYNFTGASYALNFALPNFYFHFVTAYDILRHHGVEIGKKDYMGQV